MHMSDKLLRMKYGWVKKSVWFLPFSIEVAAKKGTSVVSIDDAVWIKHGDNSYYKVLSELVGFFGKEVVYKTIEHV